MSSRLPVAALSLLLSVTAAAQPEAPAPVEVPARTARTALPDVTADVLQPGEGQLNLLFLQYSRGLLPGLQLSAHLGGYLLTLVNLTAEYQFVNRPELRASIQGGAYWFAASQLVGAVVLQAHLQPRVTVPLLPGMELNLSANARLLVTSLPGLALDNRDVRGELALLRYDEGGAWLLEGRFPLLSQQNQSLQNVLGQGTLSGSLLLDDLASWGVLLARDFAVGETMHVRLGLGYRNRPGILMLDSIGNLLFQFDLYWR